ncbi:MAG: hypothetical protein WC719_01610 [Patescibacteria group bacterium]|jgi:hypothetical protein
MTQIRCSLEKIYDDQLKNLVSYGCPEETIWELEDLKTEVLGLSQESACRCHFPFLPVLPKPYMGLVKEIFHAKHGVDLVADEKEYDGKIISDQPYYIIGVRKLFRVDINNFSGYEADFNEIISLSLFSGLSGPFFAYNGNYVITEGCKELGIWINTETGGIGPFRKTDDRPSFRSFTRILKK